MALKYIYILIVACMMLNHSCAQADKLYRNKNWNPKASKYFFSTKLTYAYKNDMAIEDHLKSGEFSMYVDEKSGTFMFNRDSYGWSGEMVNFVIAERSGNYILGYTDEHGKKYREVLKSDTYVRTVANIKMLNRNFDKYCKPTGKTQVFGTNNYGWPTINGAEYLMTFQKTEEKSLIYLAASPYDMLPVYLFNTLKSEAKLPYEMDYSNVIPSKYKVTGEKVTSGEKESSLTLMSISPTEYFLDISQYRIIK